MYSYVFYSSIQLYTQYISKMAVAMLFFKYHHFRYCIQVYLYISVLEISDGFSEKLDQVKT